MDATFFFGFVLFSLAVSIMAVGVIFKGRHLSGSCGGKILIDDDLEDCVCAKKEADVCLSDEGNDLVRLAQLGHPSRNDFHKPSQGGASLEV